MTQKISTDLISCLPIKLEAFSGLLMCSMFFIAYNGIGLRNVRLATQVVLPKLRIDFKTKDDVSKQNSAWIVGYVSNISFIPI